MTDCCPVQPSSRVPCNLPIVKVAIRVHPTGVDLNDQNIPSALPVCSFDRRYASLTSDREGECNAVSRHYAKVVSFSPSAREQRYLRNS